VGSSCYIKNPDPRDFPDPLDLPDPPDPPESPSWWRRSSTLRVESATRVTPPPERFALSFSRLVTAKTFAFSHVYTAAVSLPLLARRGLPTAAVALPRLTRRCLPTAAVVLPLLYIFISRRGLLDFLDLLVLFVLPCPEEEESDPSLLLLEEAESS